ncbi:MAG: MoxR family ATPase [Microcystis sp. M114S2]|jgi:MoxR-like ATPase|uniref:AAA family ATPase n=1 Tax=unclassified Microcystis TaxID=2643300 RepID=UPI0025865D82|nr:MULTISPECIES: MoxR family ATPase [unclassified Microcystis]MCA2669083.1 MoxR family ATPase [Microcystis sp. M045S2]MCA2714397.1 MoxR family ATPase [Microcystis sp. M172S2]MCA2803585.1 MoxR family ATPase [Microcystis sp. M114S2]MCA2836147.1 MoxR family ATPase [Microcystis sp. M007S1]MCA2836549.1 MoxR family ATPase [Microcystis sp. M078S1]
MRDAIDILMENLSQSIVGQTESIRIVLVALLSGGHALLEDVPGVGKTLLAKSLARSINGRFQRVQCTPDLLPSDITGTTIWNPNSREFEFIPGPAFANVLLADEINRATPRTQSALLEVMEEKQVTIDGEARLVPQPFFVIATQNPIEYQGTFPLPEAQMDRFAVCLSLGYPSAAEELKMLQRQHSQEAVKSLEACISLEQVVELQRLVSLVKVAPALQQYIVDLVRATRDHEDISLGVSPRGCVVLQKAVQAYAFLEGRDYAIPDDVKLITPYVFCHRLIPSHGRQAKAIVERLLQSVAIEDRIYA